MIGGDEGSQEDHMGIKQAFCLLGMRRASAGLLAAGGCYTLFTIMDQRIGGADDRATKPKLQT